MTVSVATHFLCNSKCEYCADARSVVAAAGCISCEQVSSTGRPDLVPPPLAVLWVRRLCGGLQVSHLTVSWGKILSATVELSFTISPIVGSENFLGLWVSRRRSGTAVGLFCFNVWICWCGIQQARKGFVARVLEKLTTRLGKSWQRRKRARGLQSVCEATRLVAYRYYRTWSGAIGMLYQEAFCWRAVKTIDVDVRQWGFVQVRELCEVVLP